MKARLIRTEPKVEIIMTKAELIVLKRTLGCASFADLKEQEVSEKRLSTAYEELCNVLALF